MYKILMTMKMVELESQADASSDINELVIIDLTTQNIEHEPKREASSIEETDFLTLLDIVVKLTVDVRGLYLTIEESVIKNEKLLLENMNLNWKTTDCTRNWKNPKRLEMPILECIIHQIIQYMVYQDPQATQFMRRKCALL